MNYIFNPTDYLALGLGPQELLIIGGIVLLLFGGSKIPQLMKGFGQGVGEFKKGLDEVKHITDDAINSVNDDKTKP